MKRDRALAILYEMAIVIGGEIRLDPLLTKTLQRLLFHTSFPCGMVFLDTGERPSAGPGGDAEVRIEMSVGDFELARYNKVRIRVPGTLLAGGAELAENPALLNMLPCRKDYYTTFLRLPIGDAGVILLLSPCTPAADLPLTMIFQPVLNNLVKSIELCRSSEAYTQEILAGKRMAEKALQRLSYRNRLILDSVGDGICGVDRNGYATFVNPAAARMLGYRTEELVGRSLHEIIHRHNGEPPGSRCPVVMTVKDGGIRGGIEDVFLRKDGTRFPVELTSTPLRESGLARGAVIVFRDISQRREKERDIRQLASIVASSDDAIIGKTLDGTILSWNRGAEAIYGYTEEETKGDSVRILCPPDCEGDLDRILERIRRGEHLDHYETVRVRKDGRKISVSLTVSPVKEGNVVVGASTIARDITERKEAESRAGVLNELIRFFRETFSRKEYLDAALALVRSWSGCRHAGIRVVRRGGVLQYESYIGYDADFLRSEGTLSLERDQCVCTRVATGSPACADRASMTPGGSFCSNDTASFLTKLSGPDHSRFRGVCMAHGYQSLAVIPIRYRDKTLGAIHLADERPERVPVGKVEFLEQMAHLIGEAMFRFGVEDDLRHMNAYNRSLIEASLDPLVTIGPDGKITDVNKATEEVTGLGRDELTGTVFSDYFAEPEMAAAACRQAFRDGSIRDFLLKIRHRLGHTTPVLYNASLYRNEEGAASGLFATARDITG